MRKQDSMPLHVLPVALALLAVLTLARAGSPAAPGAVKPPTFVATYSVAWHGITAGHSTLTLARTGPEEYRYSSVDRASGLFHLFLPHDITQESRFRLVNGQVQPLSFRSQGGGPPEDVHFDWARARVSGSAKHRQIDLKLEPGTQDPGSVQIALMLGFLTGKPPASFWMLNTDVINHFQFLRRGEATLHTPLGELHTLLYTSHHPGARRTTYMWLAPSLDYLPARLEQHRGGSTLFALNILSFKKG